MTVARLFHGTNAEMIRDGVVPLGHLRPDWSTLDPTWGKGNFWTAWQPDVLVASDVLAARSPIGRRVDFGAWRPYRPDSFDVVVVDPPYKLNGTPKKGGPASSDEAFGVDVAMRWQDRHALMLRMLDNAAAVARHRVLFKCQDQVCSGAMRWQTDMITRRAESLGLRKADRLDRCGGTEQPPGKRQVHARSSYSTLLIFALPKGHRP